MGTSCSSVWLRADPSPSLGSRQWGLQEQQQTLPQQTTPGPAVPNSPLGGPVLLGTVLEGPESSNHASCSCQQPICGQGLGGLPPAPVRDVTGWDYSHGSPHMASLRVCPRTGMEASRASPVAEERRLAACLAPLSSQSHLDHGTEMSLARKMLQKQQLEGSGGTSPGWMSSGSQEPAQHPAVSVPSCCGLPHSCNVLFIKQEHLDFLFFFLTKIVTGLTLTN